MSGLTLYLIRHAPVTGKDGIIYGDDAAIDISTQNHRLAELHASLPAFKETLWYYSGVSRTYETAKALKIQHLVRVHEGWREQHFGSLIDQAHNEVAPHLEFIDGKIFAPAPPQGEALERFISRTGKVLSELKLQALQSDIKNIAIITHGGTIRAAHAYLNDLDIKDFIKLDTPPLCLYKARI